jgi:hypothetical protein
MKTHPKGIYTLANDNVIDQLIALLNSIEANYSKTIPVCVIPYDDNIKKVNEEIGKRKNVFLFDDESIIKNWEEYVSKIWKLASVENFGRHMLGVHRKLCVFNGPFRKFVFLDGDDLIMKPLHSIFNILNKWDVVVNDYQYKDTSHVFNENVGKIFSENELKKIFCVGFYASKKDLFKAAMKQRIIEQINKESEILYSRAPEQSILNYMVLKSNIKIRNLAFDKSKTGNSAHSHFTEKNHILYDKGNRLTYLHYIGVSKDVINKVCAGENLDFPYRDIFLYYRFMKEPDKMPVFKGKPKPYGQKSLQQILMTKFRNLKHKLLKIITQK